MKDDETEEHRLVDVEETVLDMGIGCSNTINRSDIMEDVESKFSGYIDNNIGTTDVQGDILGTGWDR
ncbi:hypothetical protein TNCV_1864001 [Trichonephila clavipes]|nr:hypothetical protein TNCV_1864001 [Trichonephila clavipes]